MQKKPRKERNTLPKKISARAKEDVYAAGMLAARGREFTFRESMLSKLFELMKERGNIMAGNSPNAPSSIAADALATLPASNQWSSPKARLREVNRLIKAVEGHLTAVLLNAVRNQDSQTLIEFGTAIESIKKSKAKPDPRREQVLFYKAALDTIGQQMTIGELALAVKWPESGKENGYATLRDICHEVGFPLAVTTEISYTRKLKKVERNEAAPRKIVRK